MQKELIEKYGGQVPRYTSYPTAPHFTDEVGGKNHADLITQRDNSQPVSLYFHIPFCEKLCWYCGCSMKVVNSYSPIERYVKLLIKEIGLLAKNAQQRLEVSHIHFGGGTPTVLEPKDTALLFAAIAEHVTVLPDAEIAMEGDPRTMTLAKAEAYKKAGVNRVSFGIQDFDAKVQKAINREQPFELVNAVLEDCRLAGLERINIDLMYGLPHQNIQNFEDSIDKALSLRPDRVALFGYAHVPWMKKHMKLIPDDLLPDSELRMELFDLAAGKLEKAGFVAVGLDHFVRDDDPMAQAFERNQLNRNFQGYTTDLATDLIGLGVSSISSFAGRGYTQNIVSTTEYENFIEKREFATYRGIVMSEGDVLQGEIIKQIMCYYCVDLQEEAEKMGMALEKVEYKTALLEAMAEDGVIAFDGVKLTIAENARALVRVVASAFDSYFMASEKQHSKAL